MMKYLLSLLIFVSSDSNALSQDSIFIISHYTVSGILQECKGSDNELQCLEEIIDRTQQETHIGNNYRYVFEKKKKALVVYHINAGWIQRKRGNYTKSNEHFKLLNLYTDSLKIWGAFRSDMEDILMFHSTANKAWCFDIYRTDSAAFYACNCDTLFPELKEKPQDSALVDSPVKPEIDPLHGKIIHNDTLRIAPQFLMEAKSSAYFEEHQTNILNKLSHIPVSELLIELSSTTQIDPDTLILKVEFISNNTEQLKKCSIAKSSQLKNTDHYYRNAIMQMDLPFPREDVAFFIPIIFQPVGHSSCCDLDKTSLGSDHFLIQYELGKQVELDSPQNR